jgi:hypothetical protein
VYESLGDFQGILQEPYVKELAEQLQNYIHHLPSSNRQTNQTYEMVLTR